LQIEWFVFYKPQSANKKLLEKLSYTMSTNSKKNRLEKSL